MNIKHEYATLIINREIVGGVIYENDTFQAGRYDHAEQEFFPAWPNPLSDDRDADCIINVAGVDFDPIQDGKRVDYTAKMTKQEALDRMVK